MKDSGPRRLLLAFFCVLIVSMLANADTVVFDNSRPGPMTSFALPGTRAVDTCGAFTSIYFCSVTVFDPNNTYTLGTTDINIVLQLNPPTPYGFFKITPFSSDECISRGLAADCKNGYFALIEVPVAGQPGLQDPFAQFAFLFRNGQPGGLTAVDWSDGTSDTFLFAPPLPEEPPPPPAETPEPGSLALLSSGLIGIGATLRRKFMA